MDTPLDFLIVDSGEDRPELIARFEVFGEPQSKARARTARRGDKIVTYSPTSNRRGEDGIKAAYLEQTRRIETSADKAFAVRAIFYHATRQRRDVDNMLKLVLDGLNKVAWADDTQVVEVTGRKILTDKSEARTVVEVYRIGDVPRLTTMCHNCGVAMVTYPSWLNAKNRTKFCSAECRQAKSDKVRERKCLQCGAKFISKGKMKDRKFCSTECKASNGSTEIECAICGAPFIQYKSWAKTRPCCSADCSKERAKRVRADRATTRFRGQCLVCGAGTTRKEYRRCNPCKLEGKAIPLSAVPYQEGDA